MREREGVEREKGDERERARERVREKRKKDARVYVTGPPSTGHPTAQGPGRERLSQQRHTSPPAQHPRVNTRKCSIALVSIALVLVKRLLHSEAQNVKANAHPHQSYSIFEGNHGVVIHASSRLCGKVRQPRSPEDSKP